MANFNVNKTILGGRMAADPELKQTSGGISVCSFRLAVNRKYSKDGEQTADFINCQAWRQTAEFICKYFHKGSSICICGSIQTRTWTDNNGQKRFATEVVADEALFVDSKNESVEQSQPATPYTTEGTPNFQEVNPGDDLPF